MPFEGDNKAKRANKAYVGLGANLGDPIQQIVDARRMLFQLSGTLGGQSSCLYVSSPVGYSDQPDFINCVVEVETLSSAHELFSAMQSIENKLGRVRDASNQNAPRMIDLDLLIFSQQQIDDEILMVPHPRIGERLFVLQPLLELVSNKFLVSLDIPLACDFSDQQLHALKC